MINKISNYFKALGQNVFDIAMYNDGEYTYATVNNACKCQNSYSISKSIISIAVGIAQSEGYLSLDDHIIKYFSSDLPEIYDEKIKYVTIRHLLTMSMGHGEGYLFEIDRYTYNEKNWLKLCLSKPLEYNPGERFVYSNSCYYLLSCLLHKATGIDSLDYIAKKIFSPLLIDCYSWERCPRGEIIGATGLYISSADLLKIGVMCLDGGKAPNGGIIIDPIYLSEATKIQAPKAKYGYGFWIGNDCYKAVGSHSQTIDVYPQRRIVFVAHAYEDNIKYEEILKQDL